MICSTKPLVLGYIRAHVLMTEPELAGLKARLSAFARREGYTLGTVYVEHNPSSPAAFHALLDAVLREGASAVIVPSMRHFSALGAPASMKDHLEHTTGAHVLVAGTPPP